jgi:hypothetical protein
VNTPRSSPAPLSPSSPGGRLRACRAGRSSPRRVRHPRYARRPSSIRLGQTTPDSKAKTTSWARSGPPSLTIARLTLAGRRATRRMAELRSGTDVLPGQLRARRRTHRTRPREAKRRSLVREREPRHAQVLITRGQPRRHAGVVNGLHQRSLHRPVGDQMPAPNTGGHDDRRERQAAPQPTAGIDRLPDPASSGEEREIDRATPRPWPLPPVVPERMASPDDAT